MKLYRAIVENNLDPEMLARVQVRISGIHTQSKIRVFEGSTTDNLPWAEVIGGTDFGLINGVGTSSVLQVGTMVWLLLEDDDPNRPIIIGVIKGITEGESDINKNAREITDGVISKKNSTLDYLESAQPTSVYPENHVIESASGHMIELDDTPGQERVQVIDRLGNYSEMNLTAYIDKAVNDKINVVLGELKEHIIGNATHEFDSDVDRRILGELKDHVVGNTTYQLDADVDRTILGKLKDHTVGNTTIDSDGGVEWNITGDFKINVSGNILIDAGAGATVSGGPDITMTAGTINLN